MTTLSPPATPVGQDSRPRATTSHSYVSTRSKRSSKTQNKLELIESPKDKRKMDETSKADPRRALNEDQPVDVALQETTTEDLRSLQHKDMDGQLITDPDRSNPTRHRLERPLQTIMSFQDAAEGTSRRRSYQSRPSPGAGPDAQNRRSSYYGNGNGSQPRPRPNMAPGSGGYYRNSSYGTRPETNYNNDHDIPQPPYGRPPRNQSNPYYNNVESPGSGNSYQAYDQTSGSDEFRYSTGPSSQNSSFDHLHQMTGRKQDEHGMYENEGQHHYPPNSFGGPQQPNGHRGYPTHNGNDQYSQQSQHHYPQQQSQQQQQQRINPLPPVNNPKRPIPLNTANSGPPPTRADLQKALPDTKRQSWLRRTFSKRD